MRSILGFCNIFEYFTAKTLKLYKGFPSSKTEFRIYKSMSIFKCTIFQEIENDRLCEVFEAIAIFLNFWQQKIQIVLGISQIQNWVPHWYFDVIFLMNYVVGNWKRQIVRCILGYCNIFEYLTTKNSNCIRDFRVQ